jgi:N-acetylglucosaminyl-diphospho-decaprenol L-rhamnosyltransferase
VTSAPPRLDIVIVNWNAGAYLADCVRAVSSARRSRFELSSVTVVDNASTDGSLALLDHDDVPLALVRNDVNRGFAVACNQGAELGDGDYILFLNPDTRVSQSSLDESIAFMSDPTNASVGICGGQMIGDDGRRGLSCSRFPTLSMFLGMMTGLSQLAPRRFPAQRLRPDELTGSGVVDQVIGAFFLVRRPLFDLLGGFDERFFMYMEEVDLSYRARQLGFASYYLEEAVVYHKERVSSDRARGDRLAYLLRSRSEYARKHWTAWQSVLLPALILLVELPLRAVQALARGNRGDVAEIGHAAPLFLRYVAGRARSKPVASRQRSSHAS